MAESSIRVITRTIAILECFEASREPLGVSELSRRTQLSKSTVHHFVRALMSVGLLAPAGTRGLYRLGPKLAQLGTAFTQSTDPRDLAEPALIELRDLTGETATLHVKFGTERVVLAQAVSRQSIRRVLEVGLSRPIYLGAVGIVLMGDMPDDDILRYVRAARPKRLTSKTVTDPAEIMSLVRRARIDGYCTLSEQTGEGVGAIAVPLHDHLGRIPAAIVISGPTYRWNPKTMVPFVKQIKAIVQRVSDGLGCPSSDGLAPTTATAAPLMQDSTNGIARRARSKADTTSRSRHRRDTGARTAVPPSRAGQ